MPSSDPLSSTNVDVAPRFPLTGANPYVYRYIESLGNLAGKTVVDVPCGDGRATYLFSKLGATVLAYDLFPEFMRVPGIEARRADLNEALPIPDATADIVICQEGIEHLPNQLAALSEFNRILKPAGILILTCPSVSHVRARLSNLLIESDSWRRMPPSLIDSVWVSDANEDRIYFGHVFLVTVQRLHTLCSIAGFRITERRWTDVGLSSLLLGIVLYPLLALTSWLSWRTYARKRRRSIPAAIGDPVWRQHAQLNVSPVTLFCKHVFWIAQKDCSTYERRREIRGLYSGEGSNVAADEPA